LYKLPVESKDKLSSTLAAILDFQSACDSQFRGERKILTLVQKKEEEKILFIKQVLGTVLNLQ
jgi:hypothetical protein